MGRVGCRLSNYHTLNSDTMQPALLLVSLALLRPGGCWLSTIENMPLQWSSKYGQAHGHEVYSAGKLCNINDF